MDTQQQSSFNNSTSFFENLLYKDLLADYSTVNTSENEDASTVAPDSRSTSCKSEVGKNFNPFALFAPKYELESAKYDLKTTANSFKLNNEGKNQEDKEQMNARKKKTIKLKRTITVMLKENIDEDFKTRFQDFHI